jgi:hypothetical protein
MLHFARRRHAAPALLALALAACTGPLPGAPLEADLVLLDGRVFTADPERPWAEALAIRGERIVAVGTSESLRARAKPGTRTLSLGGRLVVPGINDAHTHLVPRPAGVELDGLSEDPELAEASATLARAAAGAPPASWIYGTVGARVLDDPTLDRRTLDVAAPGRAVLLTCWSGHGVLASSEALRRLGIAEDALDPPGGSYARRAGAAVLTGLAHEYAGFLLPLDALATPAETIAAVRARDEEARGLGITTLQLMGVGAWTLDPEPVLAAAGARLRWRFIDFTSDPPATWRPRTGSPERGAGSLATRSGTKWILDGTPVERLMWLREPYADRPGERGRPDFPAQSLAPAFARAREAREPLLLHAVGDAAIDAVLDALDATGGAPAWRERRVRIEHADLLGPERFARARALGVVVVQNPSHFMIRALFEARLGAERTARAQAVKSLLAAGIPLALGSDGPLSPWLNLMFATAPAVNPAEALTREQALLAYTRGSAWAEFQEDEKGMLRAGMLADLAVLS